MVSAFEGETDGAVGPTPIQREIATVVWPPDRYLFEALTDILHKPHQGVLIIGYQGLLSPNAVDLQLEQVFERALGG